MLFWNVRKRYCSMSKDDFDVTKMMTENDVTKFQTVIFSDVANFG